MLVSREDTHLIIKDVGLHISIVEGLAPLKVVLVSYFDWSSTDQVTPISSSNGKTGIKKQQTSLNPIAIPIFCNLFIGFIVNNLMLEI